MLIRCEELKMNQINEGWKKSPSSPLSVANQEVVGADYSKVMNTQGTGDWKFDTM